VIDRQTDAPYDETMRIFRLRQSKPDIELPVEPSQASKTDGSIVGQRTVVPAAPATVADAVPPVPSATPANRLITLLGREFPVVREGLEPTAVAAFLENVAGSSGAALQRLEHYASLQKLCASMETMVNEARQMAEHIKEQALKEAEIEKNRLLAESLRDAEAIRNDSMRAASQTRTQAAAEAEVEKGRLLEDAKSDAIQMAAQAELDVRQLRGKAQQELESERTRLLEAARQEAERVVAEARQGINAIRERAVAEAESEKTRLIETARTKSRQLVEETRQACSRGLQSAGAELSKAVSAIESSVAKPLADSPTTSPTASPRPGAPSPTTIPPSNTHVEVSPIKPSILVPPNGNGKSTGEVALLVPPEANLAWILQLRRRLERLSGAHIVFQGGADKAGTVVVISLGEPVSLAAELSTMPGVDKVVEDETGKAFPFSAIPGSLSAEQHPRKTMTILLQKGARETGDLGLEPVRQPG
jgi:F0F1-type ATP synthase membrane subunit b/b'